MGLYSIGRRVSTYFVYLATLLYPAIPKRKPKTPSREEAKLHFPRQENGSNMVIDINRCNSHRSMQPVNGNNALPIKWIKATAIHGNLEHILEELFMLLDGISGRNSRVNKQREIGTREVKQEECRRPIFIFARRPHNTTFHFSSFYFSIFYLSSSPITKVLQSLSGQVLELVAHRYSCRWTKCALMPSLSLQEPTIKRALLHVLVTIIKISSQERSPSTTFMYPCNKLVRFTLRQGSTLESQGAAGCAR
ncbi:predicted protein [Lichtheimia corymbifera JMRC:FSU:9682]|uniref:Uncharacterized protein n=1 Tax=Lichtheimia corymbifera JMRC:FSU:9682 TaxID=1263082 RepID=A0A068S8L2_9FUNG|nr:predicted protein [Lichtheimia corymbifera JMRC:FSU:9682]